MTHYWVAKIIKKSLSSLLLFIVSLGWATTVNIQVDVSNPGTIYEPAIFGTTIQLNGETFGFDLSSTAQFGLGEISFPGEGQITNYAPYDSTLLRTYNAGIAPEIYFNVTAPPSSLSSYSTRIWNILRHYTQGASNGYFLPIKYVRFGNEPDGGINFWSGTTVGFFQTYQYVASVVKGLNPNFILIAPGLKDPVTERTGDAEDYTIQFLDYCKNNNVPLDIFAIHAYTPNLYRQYNRNSIILNNLLSNYSTLSPLYGKPLLSNNEWNLELSDFFTGTYATQLDTAWAAAHNSAALMLMIQSGVNQSIRYGGPFVAADNMQHDFLLVNYPDYSPKPAYWGLKAVNSLSGSKRLTTLGYDSINFATMTGQFGFDTIRIVLANWDTLSYLSTYITDTSNDYWIQYRSILSELRVSKLSTYQDFRVTLTNMPWTNPNDTIQYRRYLVDDTAALDLVEDNILNTKGILTLTAPMSAPSVQVIELVRISNGGKLLPDVKLLTNSSQTSVIGLDDYNSSDSWGVLTTGKLANVTLLPDYTVNYNPPLKTTPGIDTVTYVANTVTQYPSILKYSTYLLRKFPRMIFDNGTPVENNVIPLGNYVIPGLPPAWPVPQIQVNNPADLGKINTVISSDTLSVSVNSPLLAPVDIILTATPNSPTTDWDKEIIRVYEVLNNYGLFNLTSDTGQWAYENAPNTSQKPAISYLNTFRGATGVMQMNFYGFNQGVKMTLAKSNWLVSSSGQWYTIRMKIASDTTSTFVAPTLFLYNGTLPNPFDVSAHALISAPTSWTWLETSLYCDVTSSLYPQIVVKNGNTLGKLYIDAIEIIPAEPGINLTYGIPKIPYDGGDWDSANDTTLWSFESAPNAILAGYSVFAGILNVNFSGNTTEGIKLTGITGPGQTATTPIITGKSTGMKMDFSITGSLNNSLIQLAVFGVDTPGSTQFRELGATAAFNRNPSTGTFQTSFVPRYPYIYGQVVVKNKGASNFVLDNMYLQTDRDPFFYWDHSLFQ